MSGKSVLSREPGVGTFGSPGSPQPPLSATAGASPPTTPNSRDGFAVRPEEVGFLSRQPQPNPSRFFDSRPLPPEPAQRGLVLPTSPAPDRAPPPIHHTLAHLPKPRMLPSPHLRRPTLRPRPPPPSARVSPSPTARGSSSSSSAATTVSRKRSSKTTSHGRASGGMSASSVFSAGLSHRRRRQRGGS